MTLRKPLSEAEATFPPATVCVTGATGYIASAIVRRLLAAGHTVHATVRDPAATTKLAFLQGLPGAAGRLRFFKADLLAPGSYDAALSGCSCLIHTASPVILAAPPGRERELLLQPALDGVNNVLTSVNRVDTVKRVVMTSSVAAVVGNHDERGRSHVYNETDWNSTATDTYLPYHRSKVLAERRAWELAGQQARWSLVTINPAVVLGPPAGNIKCESVGFMRKLLNGAVWPFAPAIGLGLVDVDDVAAAHTLAMVLPQAHGRYILAAESMLLPELIQRLRPEFGGYRLAWFTAPAWLMHLIRWLSPRRGMDPALLRATYGKAPQFDCSRAQKELGLQFMDVLTSARDMVEQLVRLHILPDCRRQRAPKQGQSAGSKEE